MKQKKNDSPVEPRNEQGFVTEEKKKRPINTARLARRTLITTVMALLFGLVASITFLVLQPLFKSWISPEPVEVSTDEVHFPVDTGSEEKSPEEMLAEYMQQEAALNQESEEEIQEAMENIELPLSDEQVRKILSQVRYDDRSYRQMYMAMAAVTRSLSKYVVTVEGQTADVDWMNVVEIKRRQTSGVVVAENGSELLVLADLRPVVGAESIQVTFSGGSVAAAEIKRQDSETGLGILAIRMNTLDEALRNDLPIAPLGNSTYLYVGSTVVALGSPLGTSGSVGYGIINSNPVSVPATDVSMKLLQTDIIGSASSSGVLFNLQGQVIGILTDARNEGLESLLTAYGISELKPRIEKLANDESFRYSGITGIDVTREVSLKMGVPYGACVISVEMDSPAMSAGLQAGDVITHFNDTVVTGMGDYAAFLQALEPDQEARLIVQRSVQGEYRPIELVLTVQSRD
ncbi:MAG: S1C family serine protease [Lachnospiraceae bacterium]|nr:S1C family serine protease [Lachnospiraceae bacterium]